MKKLIAILLICTTYLNAQTICDSVSLSIVPSSILTLTGNNSSTSSFTFIWQVCDSTACYSSSDDTAYFSQVSPFDVVKVCYDLSPQWICNTCIYVVYVNGEWILHSTVSIYEITNKRNNGKAYDLLGRELKFIYSGKMYIRNNKLYMQK
mgnify:FL=1